jgi:hypothetical protein
MKKSDVVGDVLHPHVVLRTIEGTVVSRRTNDTKGGWHVIRHRVNSPRAPINPVAGSKGR